MATLADIWKQTFTQRVQGPVRHVQDDAIADRNENTKVLRTGDFRVELESRAATVRGQPLRLTCAEFDVLVFLLTHRKRIISSNTKLATRPEECGVRQAQFLPALLSLRKKLDELIPGVQYIHTEAWLVYDFHPGA